MIAAFTNEDPSNSNQFVIGYFKNIDLNSKIAPSIASLNITQHKIGAAGKYFVKGLIEDPVDTYIVYLFIFDKNINFGTFGVFKIDFTPSTQKYVYIAL